MIKVGEMVRQMRQTVGLNKPKPFSIIYVQADRKRNKGGKIREKSKAILLTRQHVPDRILNLQPLGSKEVLPVHLDLILYFNGQPVA
jgi:hypothetical protein